VSRVGSFVVMRHGLLTYGLLSVLRLSVASPINHVVVLMLENRAFDHMFGWAGELLGIDGLTGNEKNPTSTFDKDPQFVHVSKHAPYINVCDPCHETPCTDSKIFGKKQIAGGKLQNSTMVGFVEWEEKHPSHCNVMDMFTPDKLPVLTTLAQEFAIMDRFFASVPGPTWPNRMFQLSATSAGSTETGIWYHDEVGRLFPQRTIFDQVEEANMTWRNYYNDTPWELFMEKIAFSHEEVRGFDEFFADAASGSLPSFSWLNPSSGMDAATGLGSNDQHPDHDVRLGEWLIKDVYEAVRSSPLWNETLFVITYDEHGGFFDHVPPPAGPTPSDGESSYPDKGFKFNRLGIRVPTLLISPWLPKGTVLSGPPEHAKPAADSEYDLTSILASARKLLGIPNTPLTNRDAWAATFDHVVSQKFRDDTPKALPDPPRPAAPEIQVEADRPINHLQADLMHVLVRLGGGSESPALQRQVDFAPWMANAWRGHQQRVRQWRAPSKLALEVRALSADGWVEKGWDLTRSKRAGTHSITLSTRSLQIEGAALCLEAVAFVAGSAVDARPCFPSADPDRNVRRTQVWARPGDATLRPASLDGLCLTAHLYGPGTRSSHVTLEKCNGDVSQGWAYHGSYPGAESGGELEFGDALNCLGLVSASPQLVVV